MNPCSHKTINRSDLHATKIVWNIAIALSLGFHWSMMMMMIMNHESWSWLIVMVMGQRVMIHRHWPDYMYFSLVCFWKMLAATNYYIDIEQLETEQWQRPNHDLLIPFDCQLIPMHAWKIQSHEAPSPWKSFVLEAIAVGCLQKPWWTSE